MTRKLLATWGRLILLAFSTLSCGCDSELTDSATQKTPQALSTAEREPSPASVVGPETYGRPNGPLSTSGNASVRPMQSASPEDRPDTTSQPRRWAIVSSLSFQTSGFPDLITSVLADVEGIELVERDHLESVLAELGLDRIQAAEGSGERQRLSVLVGAQRLLLLDGTIRNGTRTVDVQVIDTYSGVHLFRGHLKLDEDNLEATSQRLAELVEAIETKYADGIRAVVGIPYFVSESPNEDCVSFQEEFANSLAAAVNVAPGVAVLSYKEAQLIQNEMMFSGHSIRRFLPVFVVGRYEAYQREADAEQRLRLSVAVTDGSEIGEKIEEDSLTLAEATEVLKTRAAQCILELLSQSDLLPLTREQQEAALMKQADELVKAGDVLKAIELRETALLISPNNPRHRIQIFLDRDKAGEEYRDLEEIYPHLEYMLRNRLINIEVACAMVAKIPRWIRSRYWRGTTRVGTEQGSEVPATMFNDPRTFLLTVFPQLLRLPPRTSGAGRSLDLDYNGAHTSHENQRGQYRMPSAIVINELLRHPSDYRKTFARDFAMLIQSIPQDVLPAFAEWTLKEYLANLSKEDILAACNKTRANGTPRDVFAADFLEFMIHIEMEWDDLSRDVYSDLAALERTLDSLKKREEASVPFQIAQPYDKQLSAVRERLAERFEGPEGTDYVGFTNPLLPNTEATLATEAGLAADPIEDWPIPETKRVESYHGHQAARLLQLDETTDVVWNPRAVYLMTRSDEGSLTHRQIYEIVPDGKALFSVRTDGTLLWIADMAQRIIVISRNGERLAEFQGGAALPAFESSSGGPYFDSSTRNPKVKTLTHFRSSRAWQMQAEEPAPGSKWLKLTLFPISPGKCLACGRQGNTPETWIAMLTVDPTSGRSNVELLHRADRRYPIGDETAAISPKDLDICFSTSWACLWQNPVDPADRVAILGRFLDCAVYDRYFPIMPLAVDLQTNKVTTLAQRIPGLSRVRGGVTAVCVNGSLIVVGAERTIAWHWHADGSYERIDVADAPTQDYFLLAHGSRVHSVGEQWLALDVGRDLVVNTIAEHMQPDHMELDRYSTSACFGVWAEASRFELPYKIDTQTPSSRSVSPFATVVPPNKLEEHMHAVNAIQELGGHVGTADSIEGNIDFGPDVAMKRSCSVVCLDDQWKGGDDGLRQLAHLFDLKVVLLLHAKITAQGVRQVLARDSITGLALARMPLEADTFRGISALPRLQTLYLDLGPLGEPELGEECVNLIDRNKPFHVLSLHGPNFTDRSLPRLRSMTDVRMLFLRGTSVSLQGGVDSDYGHTHVLLRGGPQHAKFPGRPKSE